MQVVRSAIKLIAKAYAHAAVRSMAVSIPIASPDAVDLAVNALKSGGVIAVPTDTVYGIACDATNATAIDSLYSIKCRNENKPLAICVGKVDDVKTWAKVDHLPLGLLDEVFPGPVTLILKCKNRLNSSLSYNGKVAIRVPRYPFIREVVNKLGRPIALTSANVSNEPSSVRVEEFSRLWGKLSGVFDGGYLGSGDLNRSASTIVDLSEVGVFRVKRAGVANKETRDVLFNFGLKVQD